MNLSTLHVGGVTRSVRPLTDNNIHQVMGSRRKNRLVLLYVAKIALNDCNEVLRHLILGCITTNRYS